ncbi:MAG: GAF domain-containing protein [Candidatus Omnitrophica bacterium]|nr:GAF domain-containing protein [Candidatus Omnitrophota bacterium]
MLGIFVLFRNPKAPTNRSYFYLNFSVAFFSFWYFFWQLASNKGSALPLFKLLTLGIIFINVTYLHFVFNFLNIYRSKKTFLLVCYIINFYFVYLDFSMNLFSDLRPKYGFGYWPVATPYFNIFLIFWLVQCFYGFFFLLSRFKDTSDTLEKKQINYFITAAIIGFIGGSTNWPLWYNIPFPPYFNILITLYIGLVAYAIVKHQLMDIEVAIKRTAVFAGLFAFVYGTFTVVTIIGQEFFKRSLGWNQWTALIPTVFVITFALRPLEIFLTNATEKFLFQKKYDYRVLLKTFTNEILTVLDLKELCDQTVAELVKILKLEAASVILLDKDTKLYKIISAMGVKDKNIVFKDEDELIAFLKTSGQPIVKDKSVDKIEGDGELKTTFKQLNAQLCLPISLHDQLIGVLSLGAKKSGEEYTQEDIDILTTLARTEAIAISNARLFDELSKTQAEAAQREKMAVIGTLAAGINHEICNPLGIVRGQCEMFLLNLRDGIFDKTSKDELLKISSEVMNKVIKETDRATGITKRLSGFAKPSKRNELEEVFVEKEVGEVLNLIGHDLKLSNIDVQTDFPLHFPPILADKKQIQEVLFNIIRNAAQAMDESRRGRILVSGVSENGSTMIRIADNGSGIPPDKISQIFNPFYTTKAPGKGTGLGLFIVKQVVERNKGVIGVESQAGAGTTFTLSFPKVSELAAA